MRDYALLAKSFRHCAEKRECASCPMYVKERKCPDFEVRKLSADAIEELLSERDDWETIAKYKAKIIEKMESEQRDILRQLPTWISVEERLPEKHQAVLFYIPWNKTNMIGWIDEGDGINLEGYGKCYDFSLIKPSHWMPLPKPPKDVE